MAPVEPNLTQRMLNELSESPATEIKDLIALQACQAYVKEISGVI